MTPINYRDIPLDLSTTTGLFGIADSRRRRGQVICGYGERDLVLGMVVHLLGNASRSWGSREIVYAAVFKICFEEREDLL